MARVPEEATLSNASLQENGRYPSDGPLLAMVPGTVAGMHTAWTRYGSKKVPWADLIAPAIRAAKNGYEVSEGLATTLMRERESFAKYEASRALFFRDGKPRVAGDTIQRIRTSRGSLEQIARAGADGFYRGAVAERLVGDLRGKGSAIRLTDLSRYFAADREPITHDVSRNHGVFGRAAGERRNHARRAAQPARAVPAAEAVHRRRGDAARDGDCLAARAGGSRPHG